MKILNLDSDFIIQHKNDKGEIIEIEHIPSYVFMKHDRGGKNKKLAINDLSFTDPELSLFSLDATNKFWESYDIIIVNEYIATLCKAILADEMFLEKLYIGEYSDEIPADVSLKILESVRKAFPLKVPSFYASKIKEGKLIGDTLMISVVAYYSDLRGVLPNDEYEAYEYIRCILKNNDSTSE